MTRYAVLVSGQNYLLVTQEDAAPRKMGFLIWRCVEAQTPAEAEQSALQAVREDPGLGRAGRNHSDAPPRLRVQETRRGWGDLTPPGTGFIFIDEQEPEPARDWLGRLEAWLGRRRKVRVRKVHLPEE